MVVYRMVPTSWCDVVDGKWEFQSGAFDNATPQHSDESADDMSVVLSDTLEALGRDPEALPAETVWAGEHWGVACLEVRYLRHHEEQEIRRTPQQDEPAHGDVRGKKHSKRRKRMKAHASWIVRPAASPPTPT